MMQNRRALLSSFTVATTLTLALAACGGGSSSTSGAGGSGAVGGGGSGGVDVGGGGAGGDGGVGGGGSSGVPVEVQFEAQVDGVPFACTSSFAGLGSTGVGASLLDFRLYVHDLEVLGAGPVALEQDGTWQHQSVALLDFEDKTGTCSNGTAETNTTLRGTAPGVGTGGIKFKLGVPFELNHQNKNDAPSPLNLTALFWDWQGGYKFARIDAMIDGAGPRNFHLGSTGCDGDPATGGVTTCARPNVVEVTLATFDPAVDVVVVDYGALVAGVDLSADQGGAPGCMSGLADPECASIFDGLGIDIATGDLSPEQQVLFSRKP